MAKIQNTQTVPNAREYVEQQELSFITGVNEKWYSHFWKTVWQFITKLNIFLPDDITIMLPDIY